MIRRISYYNTNYIAVEKHGNLKQQYSYEYDDLDNKRSWKKYTCDVYKKKTVQNVKIFMNISCQLYISTKLYIISTKNQLTTAVF